MLYPCACGLAFFCAIWLTIGALAINVREQTTITGQLPATEKIHAVRLNQDAFDYARELIKQGRVVVDGRGAWSQHQPSTEEENEFIVCTDSENMQNGTSESTTRTAKGPKHDINFPTVISKMSIAALYSL
jgi:hypothetical protein